MNFISIISQFPVRLQEPEPDTRYWLDCATAAIALNHPEKAIASLAVAKESGADISAHVRSLQFSISKTAVIDKAIQGALDLLGARYSSSVLLVKDLL